MDKPIAKNPKKPPPKRVKASPKASRAARYDAETGALTHQELPPSHSASDYKKYLKYPDQDGDHPFAYTPGIHILVGPLGCGKSSLIYSLLSELNEILDDEWTGRVLYYTGSGSDAILKHYKQASVEIDPVTKEPYETSGVEIYDPHSKESFLEAVKEILADDTPTEERKMNIVVVDDAVNDKDILSHGVQSSTPLSKLMMSCRHMKTCMFITSQKLASIPTFARSNFSHGYFFRCKSDAERNDIAKMVNFSKAEFVNSMDTLTKSGSFIWVNNLKRTITRELTQSLVR